MRKKINKRAVSPMIGYILLITVAVVMSVIVYIWLKTYVPKEALECPDATSMFIKNYSCDSSELNITMKNSGNFNIAGYFIRIADDPEQELATIDISSKLKTKYGGILLGNSVLFGPAEQGNSFNPGEEITHSFDLSGITEIYFVELTPTRVQEEDLKERTATCGNAKVKEELSC